MSRNLYRQLHRILAKHLHARWLAERARRRQDTASPTKPKPNTAPPMKRRRP